MWLRILTALMLGPAFIGLALWLPNLWFAVFIAGIVLLGFVEWYRLSGASWTAGCIAAVMILGLMIVSYQFQFLYLICALATFFWVYAVYDLKAKGLSHHLNNASFLLSSVLVITGAWAAIVLLHQLTPWGPLWCIGFIVGIWAADSAAYFVGRAFGRHKLAPAISPGKTIEGMIGGVFGSVLVGWFFCYFFTDFSAMQTIVWVFVLGCAALISVAGDLYESRLKRLAGAKDSGHLLPGHGGMLDRIDGLLAGAPVFVTLFLL